MDRTIALIGFGEAASAFARGAGWRARAHDIKTDDPAERAAKEADYAEAGIEGAASARSALAGAKIAVSLVTADQALAAAQDDAAFLAAGAFWFDMNSVAPDTKRAAAAAVEAAGAHFLDVAVMAPVHPAKRAVPLLLAGPEAARGAVLLRELGFESVRVVGDRIGAASAIKMIRSVMVKGIEALTAECLLAAEAAGVTDEVVASLDASWPRGPWRDSADYNLGRMIAHGRRRAAELDEVVKTLDALGTGTSLARAAAASQRRIGAIGGAVPGGLDGKLALIARCATQGAA
ncbi:NAD(P)-dependent oxidoreductase [Sphingosinicella ginsenosidimutans]|uniref:NAD(P)-dependent oxidoreductase n=1 Tax=Allosphingosinicella ginsenosidimutans TaxID=1176539 RepID=A0A5C6TWL8_9SPHN|nr:DUF1932 domain-containing protein [Sphingosinicella ginsenosidimutans]TXC64863.1 NAD(P)-dependent oxidoreductase [Sphingosinicella ginsenosidimutans]